MVFSIILVLCGTLCLVLQLRDPIGHRFGHRFWWPLAFTVLNAAIVVAAIVVPR